MQQTNFESRRSTDAIARTIERARADGAETSDQAILIGNRAGVVEWANRAWSRITGFPRDATVDKPISHFLDVSGIELELVDFVGQHFLEGRSCTIGFPFETFEGEEIEVLLEVRPIRGDSGEVEAFFATAGIVPSSDEAGADPARPIAPVGTESANGRAAFDTRVDVAPRGEAEAMATRTSARPLALSDTIADACESMRSRIARDGGNRIHLDLVLAPDLPETLLDRDRTKALAEILIRSSLEAIGEDWGCISVLTGRTRAGRSHVSAVHPIVARPIELRDEPLLFLEIHDTGPALAPDALDRIRSADPGSATRERALVHGGEVAAALGATLHLDSRPGCGMQALVLIPIR